MRITRLNVAAMAALIIGATACGGDKNERQIEGAASQEAPSSNPSVTTPHASSVEPIASLTAANGNVISFYASGMITEEGTAGTPPALTSELAFHSDGETIWKTLAPGAPVPRVLSELQTKTPALGHGARPRIAAPGPSAGDSRLPQGATEGSPVFANALQGCNNGCCDHDWLASIAHCQSTFLDYNWFLFNTGWSWASDGRDEVDAYRAVVCAAVGTSTLTYCTGDDCENGGTYPIAEGHYLSLSWYAGFSSITGFDPEWVNSAVNSGSSHLHTYCGGFLFD